MVVLVELANWSEKVSGWSVEKSQVQKLPNYRLLRQPAYNRCNRYKLVWDIGADTSGVELILATQ